ncbi:MAG TPA: DUF3048 domain-containing protein [Actinomycetota bacterium]
MSLTRRGRITLGLFILLVLIAGGVGAVMALGGAGTGPFARGKPSGGSNGGQTTPPPPAECPLSGLNPKATVPSRPALAVKVENLPAARPQTGLSWADIVYEEPVEGGITRFIAVYQCQNASRVEPVRSARLTDVNILIQFGRPLLGYSGGVPKVVNAIRRGGVIDVGFDRAAQAYHRDPNRAAPHNLYTSTRALYGAAGKRMQPEAPDPVFTYSDELPGGATRARNVHLPFSTSSDVFWKWSKTKKVWLRFHGTVPHVSSDGTQFSAKNVIVQMVRTRLTEIVDANGVRSPEVISVGTGKAYVLRDGRVIKGTWQRESAADVTRFVDTHGQEIPLRPGNTWVELVPQDIPVTIKK